MHESEPNKANSTDDGFYSTDYYTSNLLRYLTERRLSPTHSQQPFFAYLPFAAPHWPLQCSAADRDAYKGVFDDGPDALRLRRLAGLKRLGIIKDDVVPHDVASFGMKEWDEMDEGERAKTCRTMEVYAGMVQCIDRNVGRVMDYLETTGELDSELPHGMSNATSASKADGGAVRYLHPVYER